MPTREECIKLAAAALADVREEMMRTRTPTAATVDSPRPNPGRPLRGVVESAGPVEMPPASPGPAGTPAAA